MPPAKFITPSAPVLRREPPSGPEWLHEVKHDGWRAQFHIAGGQTQIYSRRGADITPRFRTLASAASRLACRSAILDAEIIACDAEGSPSFHALMAGAPHGTCAYCFDLLALDGERLTSAPLHQRREHLAALLAPAAPSAFTHYIRLSEAFDDPATLLAACNDLGLEGIVSKLRDDSYRTGTNPGWIKVKTAAWRQANRRRWEMFAK